MQSRAHLLTGEWSLPNIEYRAAVTLMAAEKGQGDGTETEAHELCLQNIISATLRPAKISTVQTPHINNFALVSPSLARVPICTQ